MRVNFFLLRQDYCYALIFTLYKSINIHQYYQMPHSAPLPGSLETTGWIQNCAVRSEMFLAETTRGSWERGLCLRRRRRNRFVIKSKQGYLFVKLEKYLFTLIMTQTNC